MFYKSQVTNLSKGGLFVRTRVNFPIDSVFVTVILLNQHTLNILSRVKRAIKPENHETPRNNFGMGLELINPSEDYTAYVRSYQTTQGRSLQ
jgi:Tfp pilus assembly protein PilZ